MQHPPEVPTVNSVRMQRVARVNVVEGAILRNRLVILEKERKREVRLANQDIRRLRQTLDIINRTSGHSPEGRPPNWKDSSERADLGPMFLYGERLHRTRRDYLGRFRRAQSAFIARRSGRESSPDSEDELITSDKPKVKKTVKQRPKSSTASAVWEYSGKKKAGFKLSAENHVAVDTTSDHVIAGATGPTADTDIRSVTASTENDDNADEALKSTEKTPEVSVTNTSPYPVSKPPLDTRVQYDHPPHRSKDTQRKHKLWAMTSITRVTNDDSPSPDHYATDYLFNGSHTTDTDKDRYITSSVTYIKAIGSPNISNPLSRLGKTDSSLAETNDTSTTNSRADSRSDYIPTNSDFARRTVGSAMSTSSRRYGVTVGSAMSTRSIKYDGNETRPSSTTSRKSNIQTTVSDSVYQFQKARYVSSQHQQDMLSIKREINIGRNGQVQGKIKDFIAQNPLPRFIPANLT